ncbi:MAG TPA: hypothetical protein VFZ53_14010 [Polyangiaceae bacterium]
MPAPRTLAGLVWLVVLGACSVHEPELERRGGPVPDSGTTPKPPSCASDGAGGEGGVPATPIRFCQAERVLRESCQRCHQDPPVHGAPFALVTYADTQQPFFGEQLRWERMREVVEADIMPPLRTRLDPPVEPLSCEQKATLLGWLRQCATAEGGMDCEGRSDELLTCD